MADEKENSFELLKLSFDWCKHVSTLSTGSILLMVTFLEKLTNQPSWKWLLAVALVGFVAAVVGTLCIQLEHLTQEKYSSPTRFGIAGAVLTLVGFLFGILALTAFALKNL